MKLQEMFEDRELAQELNFERNLTDEALRALAPVEAPADLSLRIRLALSHDAIRPLFQPVINLGSNRIVAFEVVPHWVHSTLGEVPRVVVAVTVVEPWLVQAVSPRTATVSGAARRP